jgi:CheY-like chemotaxis protein
LMDGSIEVMSQIGVGSSFRFTARFGRQGDDARRKGGQTDSIDSPAALVVDDTARPAAEAPTGQASDGPCALVVEDNAVNLMVAVSILETLGWKVETAGNGLEALVAHERRHFDVIFMDCQMPKMDGFQAATEIRKREAAGMPRTPIVALTASADDRSRELCLDVGMNEFITKPFTRMDIAAALATVV